MYFINHFPSIVMSGRTPFVAHFHKRNLSILPHVLLVVLILLFHIEKVPKVILIEPFVSSCLQDAAKSFSVLFLKSIVIVSPDKLHFLSIFHSFLFLLPLFLVILLTHFPLISSLICFLSLFLALHLLFLRVYHCQARKPTIVPPALLLILVLVLYTGRVTFWCY